MIFSKVVIACACTAICLAQIPAFPPAPAVPGFAPSSVPIGTGAQPGFGRPPPFRPPTGPVRPVPPQTAFRVPCGYSCSRQTYLLTNMDGVKSQAVCSQSVNLPSRCDSCCKSVGLQAGISSSRASGFIASDGRNCVCCFSNDSCRG